MNLLNTSQYFFITSKPSKNDLCAQLAIIDAIHVFSYILSSYQKLETVTLMQYQLMHWQISFSRRSASPKYRYPRWLKAPDQFLLLIYQTNCTPTPNHNNNAYNFCFSGHRSLRMGGVGECKTEFKFQMRLIREDRWRCSSPAKGAWVEGPGEAVASLFSSLPSPSSSAPLSSHF